MDLWMSAPSLLVWKWFISIVELKDWIKKKRSIIYSVSLFLLLLICKYMKQNHFFVKCPESAPIPRQVMQKLCGSCLMVCWSKLWRKLKTIFGFECSQIHVADLLTNLELTKQKGPSYHPFYPYPYVYLSTSTKCGPANNKQLLNYTKYNYTPDA